MSGNHKLRQNKIIGYGPSLQYTASLTCSSGHPTLNLVVWDHFAKIPFLSTSIYFNGFDLIFYAGPQLYNFRTYSNCYIPQKLKHFIADDIQLCLLFSYYSLVLIYQKHRMNSLQWQNTYQEGMHKEIFICRCRKQYESFPALYLHNKTKHSTVIHTKDKEKMRKKSIWSGNKKKMIYEFSSASEMDSLTQKIRKQKKESLCRQLGLKSRKQKIKTQQEQLNKLLNQFIECHFNQTASQEFVGDLKYVCSKLVTYIYNKNIKLSVQHLEEPGVKLGKKIQIFPYFLNPFALHEIPSMKLKSMGPRQILACLEQMSNWMFENKHCGYLAVLTSQNQDD